MSTLSFATQLAVTMRPTQVSEARQSSPIAIAQKPAARTNAVVDRGQALQEVYDKHVEQIYKFVYFKVGNREDAEDITSQVFIKAANSMDLTQEDQVKLAWLYQVARTTITDHWRNYYKAASSSLDEMEEASPLHLAADPIYLTNSDEEVSPAVEKVQSLLEMLPANYRQVLQLRFLQGCTLKETALAMGITEGNAKVLQHRALQKAVKVGAVLV
ncbi:MAG TPA: sigma-70 family RNA polymerase sigma factor [Chloroflexia bacterium]|nr:sigma-70 family RNA polymerase sigma factor [Chloroflexia bacterium]